MLASATTSKKESRDQKAAYRVDRVLERFPLLPDAALIELRVVSMLLGRSPASIWRDVAAGRLAKPTKIGSSTRWRVGDVRAAINAAKPPSLKCGVAS